MSNKDFITEQDYLSDDNHSAIPHHPSYDYPSYYHWQDTFSSYHFDKWADDSHHLDIQQNHLKFRGTLIDNLMDEILPYSEEHSVRNGYVNDYRFSSIHYYYHKMGIKDYSGHIGFKEKAKPEKHPTLKKIIDWFELSGEIQPIITLKKPGNWDMWHTDCYCGHPSGRGEADLFRVIIHLNDWEPGQFLTMGNQPIMQWKAGDCILFDSDIPHAGANASRSYRYSLRLTGKPSDATLEKVKKGGEINVDLL
jgi:hypothetical protein